MAKKLLYITVGEIPKINNLISSQVIPLLSNAQREGFEVKYISVVPLLAVIKNFLTKRTNVLNAFKESNPIKTIYIYSFLHLGFWPSYIFKNRLLTSITKKLIKKSIFENADNDHVVIHCRSYLATDLGIRIKEHIPNAKLIFDMRSILPIEFVVSFGRKKGALLYGSGKVWESYLLDNSDLSFLPIFNGINLLKAEDKYRKNIEYMPIMGFDNSEIFNEKVFKSRWQSKTIPYIGSTGTWHTKPSIELTLDFFAENGFNPQIISHSGFQTKHPIKSMPYSKIKEYYNSILATVISGRNNYEDYFDRIMGHNLFSTKASEALSMGVPIIVNEGLSELVDFINDNHCGIVFRFTSDSSIELVSTSSAQLASESFWQELTKNAYEAGKIFQKKNITKQYLKAWNEGKPRLKIS